MGTTMTYEEYDTRETLNLIGRAARSRWNVPAKIKERSCEEILAVLESDAEKSLKLKAVEVAAKIDKIDMEQDKAEKPHVNLNLNLSTGELISQLENLMENPAALMELKQRMLNAK